MTSSPSRNKRYAARTLAHTQARDARGTLFLRHTHVPAETLWRFRSAYLLFCMMRFYNADIRLSAQSGRAEFRQLVHSRDTLRKIRAPVNRADFLQHVNDFFLFLVVACGCKHHRDIAAARGSTRRCRKWRVDG